MGLWDQLCKEMAAFPWLKLCAFDCAQGHTHTQTLSVLDSLLGVNYMMLAHH